MKFYEYTKEERAEWRRMEITHAFLESLRDHDADFGTRALQDMVAGRLHEAAVNAGRQEGIVEAVMLLNHEDAP